MDALSRLDFIESSEQSQAVMSFEDESNTLQVDDIDVKAPMEWIHCHQNRIAGLFKYLKSLSQDR